MAIFMLNVAATHANNPAVAHNADMKSVTTQQLYAARSLSMPATDVENRG